MSAVALHAERQQGETQPIELPTLSLRDAARRRDVQQQSVLKAPPSVGAGTGKASCRGGEVLVRLVGG
jgi:hypothetical protein